MTQAQVNLADRDAAMSRGTVTYQKVLGVIRKNVTLTYSSDGRYAEHTDLLDNRGSTTETDIGVQGKTWTLRENLRREPSGYTSYDLVSFGTIWPIPDTALQGISGSPSIALAGGLSTLLSVRTEKAPLTVTGLLPDGTTLHAVFGALESKGIPNRIERWRKGKVYQVWVYTGALSAGGIYVPKHVELQSKGGMVLTSFDIKSANFSKEPSEAALTTKWLHKGAHYNGTNGITRSYDDLLAANHGKEFTPEQYQRYDELYAQRHPLPGSYVADVYPPTNDTVFGLALPLFKYESSIVILFCMAAGLAIVYKRKLAR
jgi:hypothetical protein